jgi:hypothetical protein
VGSGPGALGLGSNGDELGWPSGDIGAPGGALVIGSAPVPPGTGLPGTSLGLLGGGCEPGLQAATTKSRHEHETVNELSVMRAT